MAVRARTPQFQGLARRNRDSASGGNDLVADGNKLHSLSVGNNLKSKPGTEFRPGSNRLEQITGGAISQPKVLTTAQAEQAKAYAGVFKDRAEKTVDFYKNTATPVSKQETAVHSAWANFVESYMEDGFTQYESNSGLKQKEYQIKGKRLAQDWQTNEAKEGFEAVKQELQIPVSSRMRQYA